MKVMSVYQSYIDVFFGEKFCKFYAAESSADNYDLRFTIH